MPFGPTLVWPPGNWHFGFYPKGRGLRSRTHGFYSRARRPRSRTDRFYSRARRTHNRTGPFYCRAAGTRVEPTGITGNDRFQGSLCNPISSLQRCRSYVITPDAKASEPLASGPVNMEAVFLCVFLSGLDGNGNVFSHLGHRGCYSASVRASALVSKHEFPARVSKTSFQHEFPGRVSRTSFQWQCSKRWSRAVVRVVRCSVVCSGVQDKDTCVRVWVAPCSVAMPKVSDRMLGQRFQKF